MKRSLGLISLLLFASVWLLGAQPVQAQAPLLPEGPAACTAEQTSYRSTLSAVKDSYVTSLSADTNYGTATTLRVGPYLAVPTNGTYRSFVAFDLASLPSDAVILTATLELYQTNSGSVSVAAQPLTGNWNETTVTWNLQPAYTTTDESVGTLVDGWYKFDITAVAQKWRSGALTNHGLRLAQYGIATTNPRFFSSREDANPPRLVVEYVLRTTLEVQADTYVSEANPNANMGSASVLYVQDGAADNENHALLRFDLSSIPDGSTIISASLGLATYFARIQASAAPQALSVAPEAALAAWNQIAVNWYTAPASEGQGDPAYSWTGGFWNWLDVTNIAQGWVSGALLNHGFKLKPVVGSTGTAAFYAAEELYNPAAQIIITYGPPPCYPATSVSIGGATQGITDTAYTFNASIAPPDATPPIVYTWEADGQTQVSGFSSSVVYTWSTTGTKTITITVENCDSSVVDTHQVVINALTPACEFPLTGLTLGGPTTGFTGTQYTYAATPAPANATMPITYTWQATGQSDYTGSQSTRDYTWDSPGTKVITVTAQNCQGAAVQYYTVNVQPRPDLTISSAWYNLAEERVYYILKNVGAGTAPAGHTAELSRDGSPLALAVFNEALSPGVVRAGSIPYEWACVGATAQMRVCADTTGILPEDDEGNNCFQQTWSCDLVSPRITSGPTVSAIGETAATISWTTDEPCRSRLEYGRNGPFNIQSVPDNTLKTNHQVVLTGLSNGSLYWYNVKVTDAADNLNTSGGAFFETQPVGTDPVVIGTSYGLMDYPSTLYEFFTLYADVTGNPAGVDRVSFFLDGQLIGRDHSPAGNRYEVYVSPAALGMSRTDWYKQHALQVQAYNLQNEATAVLKQVTPVPHQATGNAIFVSPGAGKNIIIDGATAPAGTTLDVMVYGVEYKWKCTEGGYTEPGEVPPGLQGVDCGDVRQSVSTMKLYLDGVQVGGTYSPPDGVFHRTFNVSLTGKSVGNHTLRIEAKSLSGRTYTAERQIELTQGRGDLAFGRRVTRNGNVFQVTLTISNTGTGTAYVDYVDDFARGFQVVEKASQQGRLVSAAGVAMPNYNYYAITGNDWGDAPERKFRIDLYADGNAQEMILGPGEAFAIEYQLVPILYPQWEFYYIGSGHNSAHSASIKYRFLGVQGTFLQSFQANGNWIGGGGFDDGVYVDVAVQQATATADYILVTSPAGLRQFTIPFNWRQSAGTQRELNILLSRMAELAALKQGVLGFLPISPCAATLDALLEPGGYWANALHPNFQIAKSGYVLFVGEDEVIPVQAAGYGAPYSDLRYASTNDPASPELVLGRIVGDDMGTLRRGIENSLYVARTGLGFDRQRALLNSGRGPGESEFWTQVKEVRDRLDFPTIAALRWKSIGTTPDIVARIQTEMALGQSLVVYRGHGGAGSWGYNNSAVFGTWDVASLNFNGYHPFVWGLGCSTADYLAGYSNPEAWLRYGAGGYVGAVSTAYTTRNGHATRTFFNRWGDNGAISVGYAKVDMERLHWGDNYDWKAWIYQHPLLGDPKFGALPTLAVNAAQPVAPDGPIGVINLTLPDYVVTTDEEGFDQLTLPGGSEWLSPTDYVVPTWKVTYTYPQGQRVQDVVLTAQSGLTVATGLNVPTYTLAIDCDCAASEVTALQSTAAIPGWYPKFEQNYEWHVFDNPDGTSTLELLLYPFTYNPATTDARFYQEWSFDIDVFATTVDIVSLNPTQATYRLTETVAANLVVNNSGAAQPILVQPVVKSLSEDVETALPLRALHAVTGTAVLDLAVPALAAGDYYLEVTLADMAGHVLDTEVTEFAVGVAAGEVTGLTATPSLFKPGDDIALALTFQNTGDVPLNGVAIIRVQTADGVTQTAEFTHTLAALASGATTTFNDVWDSTGAISETYRVVGYVKYNLEVSVPQEVILSTGGYNIYLPLVLRSSD